MDKQNINSRTLEQLPDVLDAHTIASILNIGYVKALSLIKYGNLPYLKIGNTYRVSKKAFEAWLSVTNSRVINL